MSWFVPDSEWEVTPTYEAQRAVDNVAHLRVLSLVVVGVGLWTVALDVSFHAVGGFQLRGTPVFWALYAVALLFNACTLGLTFELQRRAQAGTMRIRNVERIVKAYIYLVLFLGASISLADQTHHGHLRIYAPVLLMTSAFLLTDARQLAVPAILTAASLLVGFSFRMPPGPERTRVFQEVVAYVPIAFVVSRIMHYSYYTAWRSNFRLKQQVCENQRLNERLKEANHRLEVLARTDEVTGLANRRGLNKHLDELLGSSGGSLKLSMIMIDIDYFKEYNDLYGHKRGDEALATVARVLARRAAELSSGFVSRWGGEEFVFVAAGMDKEQTLNMCKRIKEDIRNAAIQHQGSAVSDYVTLSQGACCMDVRSREDIELCMRRADRALYMIKASGRNGYAHYDGGMAIDGAMYTE